MRFLGWAVALGFGGYAAYMTIKSLPELVRYIKIETM